MTVTEYYKRIGTMAKPRVAVIGAGGTIAAVRSNGL